MVGISPAIRHAAPDRPIWSTATSASLGSLHIAGGSVAAAAGLICLWYGVYGWAAFFLVIAALNLAGGYWYLTIARSDSCRKPEISRSLTGAGRPTG